MMNEQQPLHRMFGLYWMDFFQGTNVEVDMEIDLSLKQQFLDLILIRKGTEPIPKRLPDGMENLVAHNLITFKSHWEPLNLWTLWELIGHFVNYRKQASPKLEELLPVEDFRLFAVCVRFPQKMAQQIELKQLQEGVYDAVGFGLAIRVIVTNELPLTENNAMLHSFSRRKDAAQYARQHYRPKSSDISTVLNVLIETYGEDSDMPDKFKEKFRQVIDQLLQTLPVEERLKGLAVEERLKGLAVEERLKGVPTEELLKGVTAKERVKDLSVDELLNALAPEAREALARRLKANGASAAP